MLPYCGVAGVADATRRQRALADVTELRGAGDHVAFELSGHRDLEHLAVFRDRPNDSHATVGEAAGDLVFAELVDDMPPEAGAGLVDRHRDARLAEGSDELDAPLAGRARRLLLPLLRRRGN